jgi:hypothetical protein
MKLDEKTLIEIEDCIQSLDEIVGLKVETIQDISQAINKQRGLVKKLTMPVVVCSVFSPDGSSVKVECFDFSGKELTKVNFNIIIDWINKEKEKYPDAFY